MKTIIVNGVEREVGVGTLGYSGIVFLANKNISDRPTITYSATGVRGAITYMDQIHVVDGMIFNVANTGGA